MYGHLSDYLLWWAILISTLAHTWCFFRLTRGAARPKLRVILGNALIGLCLLTFAGTLAESYLRFASISTDAYGASLTTKRWQKLYAPVNAAFCRDEHWSEAKPPGTYRIAFIGDSFTYGWGINDEEDRFTERLQAKFAAAGQRVEVMNVAWGGWDTKDHIWAVRKFLWRYAVDEVVLCYLPNDIVSFIPPDPDDDLRQPPKPTYVDVESSFLFDYLFHRVIAPRMRSGPPYLDWLADAYADPAIWGRQKEGLAEFVRECRSRNYRVRAALLPFMEPDRGRFDAKAIHRQVADHLGSLGVPVVDLRPALEGHDSQELAVNRFDHHPNETAHRLFAEGIWEGFYAQTPVSARILDSPGPSPPSVGD